MDNAREPARIPAGHKHCLENHGGINLVMIEMQSSEYLGEIDIVRFQNYERTRMTTDGNNRNTHEYSDNNWLP